MRIGLFLLAAQFPGQTHTEVLDRTVEAAVVAERAGFHDLWIVAHHFMSYGVCPSAVTLAAFETARRTGVERFALLVEGAGDPALTRENILHLGAEVLPRLRA